MKIAIIGAGNVGRTLGNGWAKKGHEIFFGVRSPKDDKTRQLVQSIGTKAKAGTVAEAAAFGEIVVLATPWRATEAAIRQRRPFYKPRVAGSIPRLQFQLGTTPLRLLTSEGDGTRTRNHRIDSQPMSRSNSSLSHDITSAGEPCLPDVCPDSCKAEPIDADLVRVIDAWAKLPEPVRRAIVTLTDGCK
jgi:hypothetical protein